MTFNDVLKDLGDSSAYPPVTRVERRWGQLLREPPGLRASLQGLHDAGLLVRLDEVAEVSSGVVTRANAYFVVRELPYDEVPARFRVTARDYDRVAVIEDGLKTYHRVERIALRRILKGPEALAGPARVRPTDDLLFDCQDRSKDELRNLSANGALAYLRRGETVNYSVSEDKLKGGVPAQRSQIRNRRPYWYSLHSPSSDLPRIAVPEHFDTRFVATLIPAGEDAVVLDTLYNVAPRSPAFASVIAASLNSALTALQLEMRGRTQHGEGVLKVKIADWEGLLILNPESLSRGAGRELLRAFRPLIEREVEALDAEMANPDRVAFDETYLRLLHDDEPAAMRVGIERDLRSAVNERRERSKSVAAAKAGRTATRRVAASVDAFASRMAAVTEAFPDPRTYLPHGAPTDLVLVSQPFDGRISVGEDLFSQGDVLAGDQRIASTGDLRAAQFVRSVLLHDPELNAIGVPVADHLPDVIADWENAVSEWRRGFESTCERMLSTFEDSRLREQIRERALTLLHER